MVFYAPLRLHDFLFNSSFSSTETLFCSTFWARIPGCLQSLDCKFASLRLRFPMFPVQLGNENSDRFRSVKHLSPGQLETKECVLLNTFGFFSWPVDRRFTDRNRLAIRTNSQVDSDRQNTVRLFIYANVDSKGP